MNHNHNHHNHKLTENNIADKEPFMNNTETAVPENKEPLLSARADQQAEEEELNYNNKLDLLNAISEHYSMLEKREKELICNTELEEHIIEIENQSAIFIKQLDEAVLDYHKKLEESSFYDQTLYSTLIASNIIKSLDININSNKSLSLELDFSLNGSIDKNYDCLNKHTPGINYGKGLKVNQFCLNAKKNSII